MVIINHIQIFIVSNNLFYNQSIYNFHSIYLFSNTRLDIFLVLLGLIYKETDICFYLFVTFLAFLFCRQIYITILVAQTFKFPKKKLKCNESLPLVQMCINGHLP